MDKNSVLAIPVLESRGCHLGHVLPLTRYISAPEFPSSPTSIASSSDFLCCINRTTLTSIAACIILRCNWIPRPFRLTFTSLLAARKDLHHAGGASTGNGWLALPTTITQEDGRCAQRERSCLEHALVSGICPWPDATRYSLISRRGTFHVMVRPLRSPSRLVARGRGRVWRLRFTFRTGS